MTRGNPNVAVVEVGEHQSQSLRNTGAAAYFYPAAISEEELIENLKLDAPFYDELIVTKEGLPAHINYDKVVAALKEVKKYDK